MPKPERTILYWPRGLCFWESRRRYAEGDLLDGERHGRWIFWYKSGAKQMEGEYVKGAKTGRWVKWDEGAAKITEGDFLYGKMHGMWTDWYKTGQKALVSHWHMGKRDGEWTYWDAEGGLIRRERHNHLYEEDKEYSLSTDREEKEIVRQIQRDCMHRNWEGLVGKTVANVVMPWHIACWVLLFIPIFYLTRGRNQWQGAVIATILAFLITCALDWSLRHGKGNQ